MLREQNQNILVIGFYMKKVKFILEQAVKAQRGVEIWLSSFFNLGSRWGCGQCHALATLPLGNRPSTHCTGLGGLQDCSGWVQQILLPIGFDS